MGFWDPGECLKIMTAAAGWLHRSMAAIQRMSRLCCFIKFESLHKIFESFSVQTQSWFFSQELFLLMVTFIFWRHLRFFLTSISITFQFLFHCYFKQCRIVNLKKYHPFPQIKTLHWRSSNSQQCQFSNMERGRQKKQICLAVKAVGPHHGCFKPSCFTLIATGCLEKGWFQNSIATWLCSNTGCTAVSLYCV